VALLPMLALIALLVRLDSPGPVLFVQKRVGQFDVYKFRTMVDRARTPEREILGYDPEVTRIGKWLRRFKLDELPQIFVVFRGDMSIVGPRPGLPNLLETYDEFGRKRLQVRPGITGLAQINGNIYLSWPERWRYDAQYVDNLSLKLDLWIIVHTIAVVLFGEGSFLNRPSADQNSRKE